MLLHAGAGNDNEKANFLFNVFENAQHKCVYNRSHKLVSTVANIIEIVCSVSLNAFMQGSGSRRRFQTGEEENEV